MLGLVDVTLRRFDSVTTRDADGYTVRPAPVESTIQISPQPGSKTTQQNQEGKRRVERKFFMTYTELRTVDQYNEISADRIVFEGSEWIVQKTEFYGWGLPHYN